MNLIDTLSMNGLPEELQSKKKGILAIETLKEQPGTVVVEFKPEGARGSPKRI